MKRFEPHEYAFSRLVDTVIMYRGRAFYVRDISPNLSVRGQIVLTGEEHTVDQDDPELRFDCPPLGYVNTPRGALYMMRVPQRRWKQGIDLRALVGHRGRRVDGVSIEDIAKTLEGAYPKFETLLEPQRVINPFARQEGQPTKVAFSKNFCIDKEQEVLEYKGNPVGSVLLGAPLLDDQFEYLKESLEAALC